LEDASTGKLFTQSGVSSEVTCRYSSQKKMLAIPSTATSLMEIEQSGRVANKTLLASTEYVLVKGHHQTA